MLNREIIKKIEEFVSQKPRSINEVAEYIKKNWRTADRYIQQITQEFGTIETRTFRGGTRGALKIVYWNLNENAKQTKLQENLENQIMNSKTKESFSGFDIFQQVKDKDKKITIEKASSEDKTNFQELTELFEKAKKEVIIFSGNLSWTNLKDKATNFLKLLEKLIKKNIKIKIICRVDLIGKENIEKVLALNFKHNKNLIEIRHREQPLRAIIFDDKTFRLKEIKEPTGKTGELNKKIFVFYTIKDKEWTEWIKKIFWKMFSSSMDSEKRLEEINKYFKI
ncbi:hypothetical protein HN832_00120 [archaeon]|jgi:hypothetical protein|nr:hypothetical protein [archaeon]MBT4373649.1 hypothetical protein [archaeon]MBT4531703.1 hypothetical protein [archaeon]MBT7001815.1 hypothetical protein [archaeon]MBT7281800.1 hypothetical protein [archaeon]